MKYKVFENISFENIVKLSEIYRSNTFEEYVDYFILIKTGSLIRYWLFLIDFYLLAQIEVQSDLFCN